MATVHAVYANGVFRPTGPVDLPEATEVTFEPLPVPVAPPRPIRGPLNFAQLLREAGSQPSGHSLPLDFSRADLYDDDDA